MDALPLADIRICDYEGSPWRTEFWPGREYEDRAERIAIKRLLPPAGRRLVEIGAGFGRLAKLYDGYSQVILLDYSLSLLKEARERLGNDPRFIYVAANLYSLPLADNSIDTAVTVRVLHHVADIPRAFSEVARIVRPRGAYLTDFANKRHLKAMLGYWLRRGRGTSPFTLEPYEFVELNFDYHPGYITRQLQASGFKVSAQRGVSAFRIGAVKRLLPASFLASLDGLIQVPAAPLQFTPSLFWRAESHKPGAAALAPNLWRCVCCGSSALAPEPNGLCCTNCHTFFPLVDGIYDFKSVSG
ncbi:MAG: class I SAM-dependent methyltransferase [Rudaea sp.]